MSALRTELREARRIAAHYAPRLAYEALALAAVALFVTGLAATAVAGAS